MHHPTAIRLFLIFALLFNQLGGLMHGISHTLAEQAQDQSLPHDKLCDLCAAYAQLGSALGTHTIPFVPTEQYAIFVFASVATFFSAKFTAFAARAPPFSA